MTRGFNYPLMRIAALLRLAKKSGNRLLTRTVLKRLAYRTATVRERTIRTSFSNLLLAALIAVTAAPALAHHSFTMFNQSKTVPLQGTVKDFRWTNPHVFIQVLVKGSQGKEDEWSIEMTSPEHLSRAGWRPGTLKPGDKVTLQIHPLHNNVKGGQYLSGTGPNGPLLGGPPASGGNK